MICNKIEKISNALMEKEHNYDNDGLDQSEEYFRKKRNSTKNVDMTMK